MIFSNLAAKLSPEWTARNPEEQRLSMRLWGHWDALRGGDALPSRTRFTAAAGSDLRQNGFTIEIAGGTGEPVFRFVGKEVIEEYGQDPTGRPVGDVPAQSVLGWVAKNLADVMANKSPIGCEDKTVVGDYQINLRGVLLPFSEDRQRIDYIVGAVTFKKMLAETTFDDPVAEPPTDTESIAAEEPAEPVEAPAATDEAVPSRLNVQKLSGKRGLISSNLMQSFPFIIY